jgi:AcrR family transcriptional regulator
MPRPSRIDEQRALLLPRVAEAFGELGYRRATTAELARRCKVRENILYRLWKDKKEMFLASLGSLFERRRSELEGAVRQSKGKGSRAERMLAHVAGHYGDTSLARVILSGLSETDDPEIRRSLASLYGNFRMMLEAEIRAHRNGAKRQTEADVEASALGLMGLGTILNVLDQIGSIPRKSRDRVFARAFKGLGPLLLGRGGS